jgi:TorA maturation chaperone TorD
MSEGQALKFVAPEEQARANFYALLARLFYAPPDAGMLGALAQARMDGAEALAAAWRELSHAAAGADPEKLREEYEERFIGTGKAPVTLYTSAYTIRFSNEVPLAALRGELAAMGLGRRDGVHEPEDHIAALCDVMRYLITAQRELSEQQRFFGKWVQPAVEPLCSAIEKDSGTAFYRHVSRFARAFFRLEQTAFEML